MSQTKNLILFAVFFIIYEFNTYIANDMIMPGMLKVVQEFNSPIENIAKSLSLFIIGGSSLQLFLGPLCDRYGKRNILLAGNILFLIASGITPLVININQFLIARYCQGLGLCFIFIGYAMIHELFDDKAAVKLCTLITNLSIFAPLLGPIVGSAIILHVNWRYIFIITTLLALLSMLGLAKNMPNLKPSAPRMRFKKILQTYCLIIASPTLVRGSLIIALSCLPMIAWIGLAPILVLQTMQQSFTTYIAYQAVIFGGFILSSILMQFITGKFSFYVLITRGAVLSLSGLILSFIGHNNVNLFIGGLFIAAFGTGLFNGSVTRIVLTSTKVSNSMSAAMLNIIQSLVVAAGLELINMLCNQFNYSLFSFSCLNALSGIIMLWLCLTFARQVKNRTWR